MQGKVLVVDDDALVRATVERVLSRAGFDVSAVAGGAEAQEALQAAPYDVAVVDLYMPRMDGFEMLQWMQAHAPGVVPVAFSGTSRVEDALRAVQRGAFDFVAKPVESTEDLVQHISRAVEHKRLRENNERLLGELERRNAELTHRLQQLELAHSVLQSQAVALHTDLNRAMRLQKGLLPQTVPFPDKLSFAAHYEPLAMIGGDFYDWFPVDSHTLGLYIADTSGHGVSAAMLTVFLKHAVQRLLDTGGGGSRRTPGEVLSELNRIILAEDYGQGIFVSMVLLMLDTDALTFQYSNAGHPPGLVRRADGDVERLYRPAPVLGVNPRVVYTDDVGALRPYDTLLLYTDGLTEASGPAGDYFGEERLRRVLSAAGGTPEAAVQAALNEARAFCQERHYTDDLTVLALGAEPQREPYRPPGTAGETVASGKTGAVVSAARHEGRTFICVAGAGSWRESQQVLTLCEEARARGDAHVILDLSECVRLDSTFLGVLHNIVASMEASPECQFQVQNIPRPLLAEMSTLGLTSVLMHFRPEPLLPPPSMCAVEGRPPAGEELGRLLLLAHEALVEADPSNADRFAAVLQVLHDQALKYASAAACAPRAKD